MAKILAKWSKSEEKIPVYVDDHMYEFLNQFTWHILPTKRAVYAWIPGTKKRMLMHHAVIGKPLSGYVVDHIDRNPLNNQFSNLRIVTPRENCYNREKLSGKYKGVCYDKNVHRFLVRAGNKYVGSFSSENEAAMEYNAAVYLMIGETAYFNSHPANELGFETFPCAEDSTLVARIPKLKKSNTSGSRGVAPGKNGTWRAYITKNKKTIWLGTFNTKEEAVSARQKAELKS